MSDHYYTNNPNSTHDEQQITANILNKTFIFNTDSGVFSKDAVDFGSRVLIETFAEYVKTIENERILELGSGYGPITLSLVKHYPKVQAIGVEINERAYHLAEQNKLANHIENVEFILEDGTTYQTNEPVHYCLTNPPIRAGKKTIQAMVKTGYEALHESGEIWVVIQKKQGAPSMQKYMEELFGNVERMNRDKGYWILRSIKQNN